MGEGETRRGGAAEAERGTLLPSLALVLFTVALLWAFGAPVLSSDLGWQIRVGQHIFERGDVPRLDFLVFTTPMYPWVAHEWGMGVLLALVDGVAGIGGLVVLRGLLMAALLAGAWASARARGADALLLSLWMVPVGVVLLMHTALRPWLVSDLALVATLEVCLRCPDQRRWVWTLPPLLALTACFHGGWIWSGAVAGAFGIAGVLRPTPRGPGRIAWVGAGLLTMFLLCLGPYGLETLIFPLRYFSQDAVSGISVMYAEVKEWAPPDLGSFFGVLLLVHGAVTLAALLHLPRHRLPLTLLNVTLFVMALRVQRHIPVFVIVSLPTVALGLLAPLGARLRARPGRWRGLSMQEARPRRGLALLVAAALVAFTTLEARRPGFGEARLTARGYPVEVVDALAALPGGRVLNLYDWGGLIPWRAPKWRVFITPVTDAYPSALFRQWFALANTAPGWEALLEKWRIDAVLFPADSALVAAVSRLPGWEEHARDAYGALWIRRPAAAPAPTSAAGAPPPPSSTGP